LFLVFYPQAIIKQSKLNSTQIFSQNDPSIWLVSKLQRNKSIITPTSIYGIWVCICVCKILFSIFILPYLKYFLLTNTSNLSLTVNPTFNFFQLYAWIISKNKIKYHSNLMIAVPFSFLAFPHAYFHMLISLSCTYFQMLVRALCQLYTLRVVLSYLLSLKIADLQARFGHKSEFIAQWISNFRIQNTIFFFF
jgi:hypothetical protein